MKSRTKTISFTLLLITACATALTAWLLWGRQVPLPEELIQANERIETAQVMVTFLEVQLDAANAGLATLNNDIIWKVEPTQTEIDHVDSRLEVSRGGNSQSCEKSRQHGELVTRQSISQECPETPDLSLAQASLIRAKKKFTATVLTHEQIELKKDEVATLSMQLDQARTALNKAQNVLAELTQ